MGKRKKTKLDPILLITLVALLVSVVMIIYVALPGSSAKQGSSDVDGSKPNVSIRGENKSNACSRAEVSFDKCVKRAGPQSKEALQSCESELKAKAEACGTIPN